MKRSLINSNPSGGVTLVELMVAVAIILLAIVPLISMVMQGVRGTQRMADRSLASQLAQEMLEEVKQKRWGSGITPGDPAELRIDWEEIGNYNYDSVSGNGLNEAPPLDEGGNPMEPRFDKFRRQVEVSYVNIPLGGDVVDSGGAETEHKLIEVRVSWNDDGSTPTDYDDADHFVRHSTVISKRE